MDTARWWPLMLVPPSSRGSHPTSSAWARRPASRCPSSERCTGSRRRSGCAIRFSRPLTSRCSSPRSSVTSPELRDRMSFQLWAVGVDRRRREPRPRRRRVQAIPIASVYTTLAHESGAKVGGLAQPHGVRQTLGYRISAGWVRTIAAPAERRGYRRSARLLVNYTRSAGSSTPPADPGSTSGGCRTRHHLRSGPTPRT